MGVIPSRMPMSIHKVQGLPEMIDDYENDVNHITSHYPKRSSKYQCQCQQIDR